MPAEYWTRPIDDQLREWNTIAGSWVAKPENLLAPYNDAPETPHILWAKPLAMGGLVGGDLGFSGMESGDAYEGKWSGNTIINGMLFYNRFTSRGGPLSQGVVALDLRTGEELWFRNNTAISFGQLLYWSSFNYHGTFAYLWEVIGTKWNAYEAFTGEWAYSMTNVPSGTNVYDKNGNILRYLVDLNNGWMAMWNSTRAVNPQNFNTTQDGSWAQYTTGKTYNAMTTGIEWNVTIPKGLAVGAASQGFTGTILKDRIIYTDYTYRGFRNATYRIFALSTAPTNKGTVIFDKTWTPPEDSQGALTEPVASSVEDGVFVFTIQSNMINYGFDINTGQQLWESKPMTDHTDTLSQVAIIYNGKFYTGGYGGTLYCYDVKNGNLLWTYNNTDYYNQYQFSGNWGVNILFVSDGKIYLGHQEHSPVDPKPMGAPFVCLDAETGGVVFRADSLFRQTGWGGLAIIGDSIIATMDTYDTRIYAIGKGPSKTTVAAPDTIQPFGKPILVKGMVTDVSAGTYEPDLTARFPNGVGAVADESMTQWMQYVYKQFPFPANATGVEVVLSVRDPNNNYYEVGRTTSDASGFYSLAFTPQVPGNYTVIATFMGSKSYWPSQSETAFHVDNTAESTTTPQQQQAVDNTWTIVGTGIAIIIAVAVGFAVTILMLRKRP